VIGARSHSVMRWTRNVLFLAGALAVCYVGVAFIYARHCEEIANSALDQEQQTGGQRTSGPSGYFTEQGRVLGRIEIPRLKIRVAILDGTTSRTLEVGVGHIEGTALPGEPGNIGIAGHRDTYFRALRNIRTGDEIRVQAGSALSRYKVDTVQIVAPDDISVLAPSAASTVTLVTCYPFYFIGAAPQRFVVHANRE